MRAMNIRLDRPVDAARDHVIGAPKAEITLVEYGSYDCPHCRAANARITEVRNELGERVRYVFRHRPISGSELARRAAELIEQARTPDEFWSAHVALMTRSRTLTEEDLRVVADDLRLDGDSPETTSAREAEARARVDSDVASSHASGVRFTPTFFINNQRYDGPWDEASFTDAMLGSLGHRVRTAALEFASWAPSTGLLLPLASGVIRREDVLGDLYNLVAGEAGRRAPEDITVFKNGGGAHLDLMTAGLILERIG
jgi:NhaA family Na+:H+ antiporter